MSSNPIASTSGDATPEQAPRTLDIYVRMNNDFEKDYCFSVNRDDPVSFLYKIFETVPINLAPSYFYENTPVGFAVSHEPGFLTSTGTLLFNHNAHKPEFLREIKDLNVSFKDVVWDGQLIVPLWKKHTRHHATIISILLVWLFTDLPAFIAPIPNMALSNHIMRVADYFYDNPAITEAAEPGHFSGIYSQLAFFAFHVVKCVALYFILRSGLVNPITLSWFKSGKVKSKSANLSREDLVSIGWTAARRDTINEWRDEYRQHVIDSNGGIVPAFQKGLLKDIGTRGFNLSKGEGFDSPFPFNNNPDENDVKLIINDEYLVQLASGLLKIYNDPEVSDIEKVKATRAFRSRGNFDDNEYLQAMYSKRLAAQADNKPTDPLVKKTE
ncbi:hypothetical protein NADFUDRAFT_83331 [Nadsonia fulvescens var. elongata DSM 6958]|uniref:Glucose-signaling factor 2 n=1 Tax=Nadsonia fulvescens var. elongata DSM 6958 TaxID=857566 RepID=A0A1E3PIR3_9ASCO|nr:hypothetical protein NADFUDRAFT_83331 [Nadsonia fulvescens var. elongata DSM 6958]